MSQILGNISTTFNNDTTYDVVYENVDKAIDDALYNILGELFVKPVVREIMKTQHTNEFIYGYRIHKVSEHERVLFKINEEYDGWLNWAFGIKKQKIVSEAIVSFIPGRKIYIDFSTPLYKKDILARSIKKSDDTTGDYSGAFTTSICMGLQQKKQFVKRQLHDELLKVLSERSTKEM